MMLRYQKHLLFYLKFIGIYSVNHLFNVNIIDKYCARKSSRYLEVELKASIMSFSLARDLMKTLIAKINRAQ